MLHFFRVFLLFFLSSILFDCSSTPQPPFFDDRVVLAQEGEVGAYAIPNIAVTPRGTVLLFATARMQSNVDWGNEQKVVLVRSLNDGQSWLKPQIIAQKPNWTVRGLAVIVDPQNGRIHYFGYQSPRTRLDGKAINEVWKIEHPDSMKKLGAGYFYLYSDDEGASWSQPQTIELDYWPFGTGIVLRYGKHRGRFVLPARTELGQRLDWEQMYNGVLISDDRGRSWRKGGLTQNRVGECCLVELSDGRLYVNNRNHGPDFGWRNHAISHDGGESFTEFAVDSQLIEPVCHASLLRLTEPDDCNVILFANPGVKARKQWDGAARRRMTVRVSFDDARSWPLKKLIYPGPCAYSSMAKGRNGLVFLAYERGDPGSTNSRKDIAVARFNLSWLKQPAPEPPVVQPLNTIFYDTLNVQLKAEAGLDIYYQANEGEKGQLYQNPLILTETTRLMVWTQDDRGYRSVPLNLFYQKSRFAPPLLRFLPDSPYVAQGVLSLLDGKKGTLNFRDGRWLGFEAKDLDIILKIRQNTNLQRLQLDFLQDTESWIFYPKKVSLFSGSARQGWKLIASKNIQPANGPDLSRQLVSFDLPSNPGKQLRILAQNTGRCPAWHPGAGGKAWLFIDEIILKME